MQYKSIKETAEKILGRPLKAEEGLPIEEIERTEKRLQLKLPSILREFHLLVGNLSLITNSSERFFPLDEIKCVDDKLVFAEEQTGIGYWGININERYKQDATVYICVEEQEREVRIWLNEGMGLAEFICSNMFYQCAQATYEYSHFLGNYSYTGAILIEHEEEVVDALLHKLENEWEKVVNRNNLVIYWNNRRMLWFFSKNNGRPDEMVLLASQTEEDYIAMLKEFNFYRGKDKYIVPEEHEKR